MLYNEFAVILGLVYNYVPFVILAIYSRAAAARPVARRGLARSRRLGLDHLPPRHPALTVPGIAAGAVFVFVLSIGNFVTPDLLGGGRFQMVGNLIYDQFLTASDWPFGAALSMVLIAVMLVLLFVQMLAAASRPSARAESAPCVGSLDAPARRLIFAFLYLPIAVLVVLSFNQAGLPTVWTGFSTEWYGPLAASPKILAAARNSLIVAASRRRSRRCSARCWRSASSAAGPRPRSMRCSSRR